MDNFKWDEDSVLAYENFLTGSSFDVKRTKFKEYYSASKQSSKDYVVECFTSDKFNYWRQKDGTYHSKPFDSIKESHFLDNIGMFKIFSVRRLSDNEVFTVGDEVVWNISENCKQSFKITSFEINGVGRLFCNNKNISIKYIEKVKQSIPLFTTVDNYPIYEGQSYYSVSDDFKLLFTSHCGIYKNSSWLRSFKNEDAAREYILFNSKCLSLNDLLDNWYSPEAFKQQCLAHLEVCYRDDVKNNNPQFKQFKKLAENKINKQ